MWQTKDLLIGAESARETLETPLKAFCNKCGKACDLLFGAESARETREIPLKAFCSKCGKARTLSDIFLLIFV